MTTLDPQKLAVGIIDGPSREEIFDSNRLVSEKRELTFTFGVSDHSRQLQLVNHFGRPVKIADVELKGLVRYVEPLDDSGDYWRVKIRFLVKFCEHDYETDSTHFFSEYVTVKIDYNIRNRKGRPTDPLGFVRKCMRFHRRWDANNSGGLWFNDTIGLPKAA